MPTKLVYGNSPHIIKKDSYKNYNYFIIKNIVGPCAYIDVVTDPSWDLYELTSPHGGLTYCTYGLDFMLTENDCIHLVENHLVIGWDYMHADDYLPNFPLLSYKEATIWSVDMIVNDCKNTIDEFITKNNKYNRYSKTKT